MTHCLIFDPERGGTSILPVLALRYRYNLTNGHASGAPSGRSRRLPRTTRPPGTAYSRRLVLHSREEALSTPGGSRGMPRRGIASKAQKLISLFSNGISECWRLSPNDLVWYAAV